MPDPQAIAEETAPADDDDADEEGVGDWILRLFRGSDETGGSRGSNDRKDHGNSGGGNGNGGGRNNGSSGGGGGDGGDDGGEGGGDDGGEGGDDD